MILFIGKHPLILRTYDRWPLYSSRSWCRTSTAGKADNLNVMVYIERQLHCKELPFMITKNEWHFRAVC